MYSRPAHKSGREARYRSLAKAVTWRITGSIDTFILSWIITSDIKVAGTISAVEIITKIILFYLHERGWALISWGEKTAATEHRNADNTGRR